MSDIVAGLNKKDDSKYWIDKSVLRPGVTTVLKGATGMLKVVSLTGEKIVKKVLNDDKVEVEITTYPATQEDLAILFEQKHYMVRKGPKPE